MEIDNITYYECTEPYSYNNVLFMDKGDTIVQKHPCIYQNITKHTTINNPSPEEEHEIKSRLVTRVDFNKIDTKVYHPNHYTWLKELCGIEVIDITRNLNFDLGNAVKYILRAGYKNEKGYSRIEKTIEDLKKAKFYIDDEINRLSSQFLEELQ